jgi:hypothetical protein
VSVWNTEYVEISFQGFHQKLVRDNKVPPWILAMVELLPDGVRGGAGLCDCPVAR